MLAEAVLVSILIGLVFKGSLKKLSELKIRYIYIPFIAFGLELIGSKLLVLEAPLFISYIDIFTLIIELIANGILIFFFFSNTSVPGMKWIFAGSAMNFLVIASNFGYMPVDPALGIKYGYETSLAALENGRVFAHTLMTDHTKLNLISDWIIIPPPWPFPKTISIGDLLIDIGSFLLIFQGMKTGHTKKNSV